MAWDEATAGMSWGEKATFELQMKLPVLMANVFTHPDGTFSHQIEPGDPNFSNPMASSNYSYFDAVQNQIEYLDAFRNQVSPTRYQRDRAFWSDFASHLQR